MMNPNNGGYYGQQQQQQYNNNNNSNMYGQQQQYNNNGAYGQPQQGMCNCCGPDPNQQQPGQQPTMCPMCCPEDPNTHFCVTDPMPQPGQMPATFSCLWQFCDGSTWLVALFFLLSVVGFAITVGMKSPDDLLGALSVANNLELDKAVSGNLLIGATSTAATPTPAPSGTNTNATTTTPAPVTATSSPATSASSAFCSSALCGRTSCTSPSSLSGSFGTVCMEDTLTGVAMLMNQSRWLNFRGALYFLAMLCSGVLLIIIVIVNKQQQFIAAGGQPGMQMPPQQQPMPYQFHGTPLYYSFRIAWGTVAIIVFFWMVTELYQYWWFIGYYKDHTTGSLHSHWSDFDTKFVPSTICVGLFLCWPLVHLCLELGLFIVGIIPWYLLRQSCYPQLQTVTVDPEKPFDHHSCCVRTDMFYMGNHQMHRLGFSEGQWTMWTGNKMPFCTICECQQQQPGQYGGGGYGGYGGGMTPPPPGNSMGGPGAMQTLRSTSEVSSKKKKSRSRRSDTGSDDSDSGSDTPERSKSVRKSKDKKKKSESPTPSTQSSAVFAQQPVGVARGFVPTASLLPPGGSSPTKVNSLRDSRTGWGEDTDVRGSKSKRSKSNDENGGDDGEVRRSRSKTKDKSSRRSQSVAESTDVDAEGTGKRSKKDKSDKKEKKDKKRKDRDDD